MLPKSRGSQPLGPGLDHGRATSLARVALKEPLSSLVAPDAIVVAC